MVRQVIDDTIQQSDIKSVLLQPCGLLPALVYTCFGNTSSGSAVSTYIRAIIESTV